MEFKNNMKHVTRTLRRMVLNALVGIIALLPLFCKHSAVPMFIIGLLGLTYWQWRDHKIDRRIYPKWWYGFTCFAIEWIAGMLVYSFIFWAIAWGFGLR